MVTREELDGLTTKEVHDRAMHIAKRRLDVGFMWDILRAIPAAEVASDGEAGEAMQDVTHTSLLIEDFLHDDEGELGEALRPLFTDYILEHEGPGKD